MTSHPSSNAPIRLRSRLSILMLTLAGAPLAGGCGSGGGTTTLSVSDVNPAGTPPAMAVDAWAAALTQQSGGRLKVNVTHGGALLRGDQAYQGVKTGVADAAEYVLDGADGFQLNLVMALPFMNWPDQVKATAMYQALLDAHPEMKAEWKVKIVGMWMMPGTHIHNTVHEIITPADLNGLKVMGAENMTVESARAAGGIPVQLDIAQMAAAVDQGTINASINHMPVLQVFGALEKFPYHTMFGQGINMTPMFIIMNNDVFDNLPADLQAIVEASGSVFHDQMYMVDVPFEATCMNLAQGWGHTITQLTPDQIAVWYNLVKQPVHDTWVATGEAAGLPAQAIYDDVLQRIQTAAATP